jgi:hypothetical protein
VAVLVIACAMVAFGAAPAAQAAPPTNDSVTSPTVISAVPSTITQDTTHATHANSDPKCVLAASVWYRFKPATTVTARVVTLGTTYPAILAIFRSRATNQNLVACSGFRIDEQAGAKVRFVAGNQYLIALSRCCGPSSGGGPTTLTLYKPATLQVKDLAITSVEVGQVSGKLFVEGTVRCTTPSVAYLTVRVSQADGDHVASATGRRWFDACTNETLTWKMTVYPSNWAFAPGPAAFDLQFDARDGWQEIIPDPTLYPTIVAVPDK